MKDYKKLSENKQIKFEKTAEGVKVLQKRFNEFGESGFEEIVMTNAAHQNDIIKDLLAGQKRSEEEREIIAADWKSRIAGARVLLKDLKEFEKK